MADNEAEQLCEIQEKYVPFLKKLIAFLEKNKKASPENLNRLKSIYVVFTTSSVPEQIEVFQANKKKLERWYKSTQKEKGMNDADSSSNDANKRTISTEDSDSSHGDNAPKRLRSSNNEPAPAVFDPNLQIKAEKVDAAKPAAAVAPRIISVDLDGASSGVATPPPPPAAAPTPPTVATNNDNTGDLDYTCASCQYQTFDENEFMKHTRTDHRSDLSMWCKKCGKCFSNAGVLVAHIKERACFREEMIYKCGVKDCTFETSSGQTFVHHLRHCHKGSPFIFCVHCQKIFTLPHCLILHMQDDCPHKEKNRKDPSKCPPAAARAPAVAAAAVAPTLPIQPQSFPVRTPTISSVTSAAPRIAVATPPIAISPAVSRGRGLLMPTSRGRSRGRGRGRGRGRPPSSSSSDEDPDDPSWKPEELPDNSMLRRSGRYAKKVNDVINAETSAPTKGLTYSELSRKEMQKCPCCDFMAAFKSVLNDHYIANHKVPNKNACLVCHLKFESTQNFLEHFADHTSGMLNNIPMEIDVPGSPAAVGSPASVHNEDDVAPVTANNVQTGSMIALDKDVQTVVKNISEANVVDTNTEDKYVRIPYQSAVQDRSVKDSKLKKFEELKSADDLKEMLRPEKLKCFFKCVLYGCPYATQDDKEYTSHLETAHGNKRLYCIYCIKEYFSPPLFTNHILSEHSKRQYQCSGCFYRAYSKIHVQIHIKHYHASDVNTEVLICNPVEVPPHLIVSDESDEVQNTTWPYVCAIGDCNFQSFDPQDFKNHNETVHRSVSVFFCHYCKVDFLSFKRLHDHYRLHGINKFQCNYCIHGAEIKDEILQHLANSHPDRPLRAYMRGNEEDVSTEANNIVPFHARNDAAGSNTGSPRPDSPSATELIGKNRIDFESSLYEVIGETYYPKFLKSICSDLTCGITGCGEWLGSVSAYVGHLRNVHAVANFACPHCPEIPETWEVFKNHLMCHGPELYSCGLVTCSFYDWDKHVVTDHLKSHANSAAKVVILREEELDGKGETDVNIVKLLPQKCPFNIDDEVFGCFFCKYKCIKKDIMKKHLYQELMYKRFSCLTCNERFISREDIKGHTLKYHRDEEIKCSVEPNLVIENIVNYFLHKKVECPKSQINRCSVCSKNFKSTIYWRTHVRLCAQIRYQPYNCDHCMQSVSDLKILKYHVDDKHYPKPVAIDETSSYLIENEVNAKIQQIMISFIKNALGADMPRFEAQTVCLVKSYLCTVCSFVSNHKYNVERHYESEHKGVTVDIKKEFRNANAPPLDANNDENSNDSKVAEESANNVKRYRCGFCIKKLYTLLELKNHAESVHPLQTEVEYSYFFSPDSKTKFLADDKELYECAYCKLGKENLYSLKNHADLMHSDSLFKVKGRVVKSGESASTLLACGYCYQRVETVSELKVHTTTQHPSLPQKSIGGFRASAKRSVDETTDDIPNKRIRFGAQAFVCQHCGAAFSSHELTIGHIRKQHPRLNIDYMPFSTASGDSMPRFYKCEFCQFTSEKQFMDPHLSAKHKNRVTCGYCNKRFEFATKLKQHHDIVHQDLPLKYSQQTAGKGSIKRESKAFAKPLDLDSIYVSVNNSAGIFEKMTVLQFSQKNNIYPKIVLERCKE